MKQCTDIKNRLAMAGMYTSEMAAIINYVRPIRKLNIQPRFILNVGLDNTTFTERSFMAHLRLCRDPSPIRY